MKLDDLREQLAIPLKANDPELYAEMQQRLAELGEGGLLNGMYDFLARYERGEALRPNFPNKMQFLYMRDRQTFSFGLIPELVPIAYQIGRMIGMAFDAPRREGVTLKEALESAIGVAEAFDYGRQEIVTVEENFAIYRTYECADCYGMPNLGHEDLSLRGGYRCGRFGENSGEARARGRGEVLCQRRPLR